MPRADAPRPGVSWSDASRADAQMRDVNINFNRVGGSNRRNGGGRSSKTRKTVIISAIAGLLLISTIMGLLGLLDSPDGSAGGGGASMAYSHVADNTANTYDAPNVNEEPPPIYEYTATTPQDSTLVGQWYWVMMVYYVFEEDGRGTMMGTDIRWVADDGVLSICITPDVCGNRCLASACWYYTLNDNELVLVSTTIPGMEYTYTRRAVNDMQNGGQEPSQEPSYEQPSGLPYEPSYDEAGNGSSGYTLEMSFEMYPFRITLNEVFLVTGERTHPDTGNKFVGFSFVFENISNESQFTRYSQVDVFVDGFLTNMSHNACYLIGRDMGSYSLMNQLSAGRSVRVHYAVEIPIGTRELELELNCGRLSNRQTEIIRLSVPQG